MLTKKIKSLKWSALSSRLCTVGGSSVLINAALLFLLFLMCTSLNLTTALDGPEKECVIVFENEDMRTRVRDECNKTNQIDDEKIVEHYPVSATLEEFDFDDNCFTNCVYKAESIMSEDGVFNRDQVQHFFKSNMTSQLFTKLTALFYACIDTTEKIANSKELNPCKKSALHEFCIIKGIITSADLIQMDC